MQFLIAKVACSVAVALLLKRSGQQGSGQLAVIRVNYAVGALLAFIFLLVRGGPRPAPVTLGIGAIAGISYVVALVLWARAIESRGIAHTVSLTRVAIVIPILASIFLWHEVPRWYQIAGVVLGLLAVLSLSSQESHNVVTATRDSVGCQGREVAVPRGAGRGRWIMFGLFLTSGVAALSSKLFAELCPAADNLNFQTVLFVVAFAAASVLYYRQKSRVDKKSLELGAALGAANLGSSVFMVLALGIVAGTLAFPSAAAAEVAGIAVLGMLVWKEKLTRAGLIGLALAVAALVLVNI